MKPWLLQTFPHCPFAGDYKRKASDRRCGGEARWCFQWKLEERRMAASAWLEENLVEME